MEKTNREIHYDEVSYSEITLGECHELYYLHGFATEADGDKKVVVLKTRRGVS